MQNESPSPLYKENKQQQPGLTPRLTNPLWVEHTLPLSVTSSENGVSALERSCLAVTDEALISLVT